MYPAEVGHAVHDSEVPPLERYPMGQAAQTLFAVMLQAAVRTKPGKQGVQAEHVLAPAGDQL